MIKSYSDSTLMRLTKAELIEHLRCAEHNRDVIEQRLEQHIENVKDWQPVIHAHWIADYVDKDFVDHFYSECSNCHKLRIVDNYCPSCGAKMDEVEE